MDVVLAPLIAFLVKIFLYSTAIKLRGLEARWMTAAMCSGMSVLAEMTGLPELIQFVVILAGAAFFIMKDTEATLFPDGVGIPFIVEFIAAFLLSYAIMPLAWTLMR